MKLYFKIFIVSCIVFFYGCDKESTCLKSNGNIVTEVREISNTIEKIDLNHNIDLVLKQDSNVSLTVTGGSNLLYNIKTEIEGNTLKIYSKNKCSYLRSYDTKVMVQLALPNLKQIDYRGLGDISSEETLHYTEFTFNSYEGTGKVNMNFNSEHLYFKQHTGPVDFVLSGYSTNLFVYTNGNGWVYTQNMQSKFVHVSCNGTGDVYVTALDQLRVELRSIGSVNYFGNPTLEITEHSGSGKIIKK